jgi:hypothetical protein
VREAGLDAVSLRRRLDDGADVLQRQQAVRGPVRRAQEVGVRDQSVQDVLAEAVRVAVRLDREREAAVRDEQHQQPRRAEQDRTRDAHERALLQHALTPRTRRR